MPRTPKRPILSPHDEMIVGEIGEVFSKMMQNAMLWAASETAKMYEPKDDIISQRKAEQLFGKRWLQQHVEHYGEKLFVQSVGSQNCTRRFSRAQLTKLMVDEQSNPAMMANLIVGIYRTLDHNLDKEDERLADEKKGRKR